MPTCRSQTTDGNSEDRQTYYVDIRALGKEISSAQFSFYFETQAVKKQSPKQWFAMSDGIEFGGGAKVYAPAEDTYLLLKAALEEVRPTDRVLEMGCGRGIISQKLKPLACRVLATDINPHAVRIARSSHIEAIQTDLFRGIKARFDLIIFNPPYLPTTPEEKLDGWINRAFDGGTSGRDTINRFLEQARDHLNPNGRILLLASSLSGLDAIIESSRLEGLKVDEIANEKHFFERLSVLRLTALRSL